MSWKKMSQVQVRTWPGPGPTLVDPVQWGPGPGPAGGWTEPGGPGPGPEKIPRTWPGPDLGQSTTNTVFREKALSPRISTECMFSLSTFVINFITTFISAQFFPSNKKSCEIYYSLQKLLMGADTAKRWLDVFCIFIIILLSAYTTFSIFPSR